jgi:ribosomal protein S10
MYKKIEMKVSSNDRIILNYVIEAWKKSIEKIRRINKEVSGKEEVNIEGIVKEIGIPTDIKKYTVLRSPHIDKKARDQ